MEVWLCRDLDDLQTLTLEDMFLQHFRRLGAPPGMMMVSVDTSPEQCRVFLHAPTEVVLRSFPGFQPVEDCDLPKQALLLVGHNDEFGNLFGQIPPARPEVDPISSRASLYSSGIGAG